VTRHPARWLLLLVAALSLQLTGCSDDSTSVQPPPTPGSPTTSSGGPSDSGSTSLENFEGSIVPGSHRVPLISWERTYPVDAVVEVPAGFITPGGWVVENGENGSAYGDLMFFGDVDLVDTNPCGAGQIVKPGPTVRDLAEALADQVPHRSTAPEPVTIGGHPGLYVETRVPQNLSRCESGEFTVFDVNQSDDFWYSGGPGSVLRFWILDVDGHRITVAVKVVPGHTTHAAEFVHMAETAKFVANGEG
jgi:hypothetical protein